jgi:hypothetical protein
MYSLHLVKVEDVVDFLGGLDGGSAGKPTSETWGWLANSDARGLDRVTQNLALHLSNRRPAYVFDDVSLTSWEAMIERGIGMMLRPPARLLVEAGMDRDLAQRFPVRLDNVGGVMGGAWVPAHLVQNIEAMIESRLERQLARMRNAEMDPVATMGTMLLALQAAQEAGAGLYEASGVLVPGANVRGTVLRAERELLPKDLRKRLEIAAKPPKKPGLFSRIGKGRGTTELDFAPSAMDDIVDR